MFCGIFSEFLQKNHDIIQIRRSTNPKKEERIGAQRFAFVKERKENMNNKKLKFLLIVSCVLLGFLLRGLL